MKHMIADNWTNYRSGKKIISKDEIEISGIVDHILRVEFFSQLIQIIDQKHF